MVCVDGSEPSLKAAKQAVDFAKSNSSQIIALYVSYIPLSLRFKSREVLDAAHEFDLQEARKWLQDIKEEAEDYHIDFKMEVIETTSSTVQSIVKYAEKGNMDLIIVGDKGRSKVERALLGSTASGIINNARCSVLVIK